MLEQNTYIITRKTEGKEQHLELENDFIRLKDRELKIEN